MNLRQEYSDAEILRGSMGSANAVKLNEEELPIIARLLGMELTRHARSHLTALLEQFDLCFIALTRGGDGSILMTRDEVSERQGVPTRCGTTSALETHSLPRSSWASFTTGRWIVSMPALTSLLDTCASLMAQRLPFPSRSNPTFTPPLF